MEEKKTALVDDGKLSLSAKEPVQGKKKKIRLLMIGATVIVVGAGSVLYSEHIRHTADSNAYLISSVCSDKNNRSTLAQAAAYLSPSQSMELLPYVQRIKSIPSYQHDPNCLYVLVNYYVNITDPDNAQKYVMLLNKVYEPKIGLDSYFKYSPSLKSLQISITALQKAQQIELNSTKIQRTPEQP
jgi:hypothetical protein